MHHSDAVLIVWILASTIWDVVVLGMTTYLVFWREHSGWWFVLAVVLCVQPTLFKCLRARFGVKEEE